MEASSTLNDLDYDWGFIRSTHLGKILYADSGTTHRASFKEIKLEGLLRVPIYRYVIFFGLCSFGKSFALFCVNFMSVSNLSYITSR